MRPRLRSFELSWAEAVFGAIYPAPPPTNASPQELLDEPRRMPMEKLHHARFFDDMLAEIPFEPSLGLRAALWMVALAPLFTLARFRTIASLSARDRERVLDKLLTSPLYVVRQLAFSLKTMATLLCAPPQDGAPRPLVRGLVTLGKKTARVLAGGERGADERAAQ